MHMAGSHEKLCTLRQTLGAKLQRSPEQPRAEGMSAFQIQQVLRKCKTILVQGGTGTLPHEQGINVVLIHTHYNGMLD